MIASLHMLLSEFRDFIAVGGAVMWLVFIACLILWLLIFERFFFFRFQYPYLRRQQIGKWRRSRGMDGWRDRANRQMLLSEAGLQLRDKLRLMQTLIILCPLMGLLGTVTGMVQLFDLIALSGNSDVKAMSSGIYRAILPTLAGLVVGLSGFYFHGRFSHLAEQRLHKLAEQMPLILQTRGRGL